MGQNMAFTVATFSMETMARYSREANSEQVSGSSSIATGAILSVCSPVSTRLTAQPLRSGKEHNMTVQARKAMVIRRGSNSQCPMQYSVRQEGVEVLQD
eukprot:g47788.t1